MYGVSNMTILSIKTDKNINKIVLSENRHVKKWKYLITLGMTSVIADISQSMGCNIKFEKIKIRQITATAITDVPGIGEMPVVGIHVQVSGVTNGHLVIVYPLEFAWTVRKIASPANRTTPVNLTELDQSLLGETSNTVVRSFINSIASAAGTSLKYSPPMILIDAPASLQEIIYADILQKNENIFVAEVTLVIDGIVHKEEILIMPDQKLMQLPFSLIVRQC